MLETFRLHHLVRASAKLFYIATLPHTALQQRVMTSRHEDDTVVTEFGVCGRCHTQCSMHLMDDRQERCIASLRMPSTRSIQLSALSLPLHSKCLFSLHIWPTQGYTHIISRDFSYVIEYTVNRVKQVI